MDLVNKQDMSAVIKVDNIKKDFVLGQQTINVLRGISHEVEQGDFLIIIGPSGCGKSTLLHILLGLEPPTSGKVTIIGKDIYEGTTEDDRSVFRKAHIGMVYQQPNWIKSINVLENVAFPLLLKGVDRDEAQKKALESLKMLKMDAWASNMPTELSGGQQQKIALCRALVINPELIVADEPTGNLDFNSGQELMELLVLLNKRDGKTIIMVTHDLEYLKFAKSAVRMLDGSIVEKLDQNGLEKFVKKSLTKRGSDANGIEGEAMVAKAEGEKEAEKIKLGHESGKTLEKTAEKATEDFGRAATEKKSAKESAANENVSQEKSNRGIVKKKAREVNR